MKNDKDCNYKYTDKQTNITTKITLSEQLLKVLQDELDESYITINKIQSIPFEELLKINNSLAKIQYIFNKKSDLINQFLLNLSMSGYNICGYGIISIINNENYGFIRSEENGYISSNDNVFLPSKIITRYGLRDGDHIRYLTKSFQNQEKRTSVHEVTHIHEYLSNEEIVTERRLFNEITPDYPNERFNLSIKNSNIKYANINTLRMIDIFCPIGKGQRGLIVAPPKSGKTTVFHDIAEAISKNYENTITLVLLVSERPEEITEAKRRLGKKSKIFYADFNEAPIKHIQVTQLCINYAKRLLELKKDVVIFLDSVTRLARSYNATTMNSGRSLSGGVDASALYQAKTIFGSARNSLYGSITVLATCLIDTGSKMDEVIFEEFKGTGNMEIILNRTIAEQGIFPAIDIQKSSTRRIDLLYARHKITIIYKLREFLQNLKNNDAIKVMISKFKETNNNNELFEKISNMNN